MGLTVSNSGGEYGEKKIVPEGIHTAVCNMVVDLGTQESQFGERKRVLIGFEFPELQMEYERDGETKTGPMVLSKEYSQSLYDGSGSGQASNLYKDLTSWRGKRFTDAELAGFDLESLLGVNAQIQVLHNVGKNGNTYANITNIMPKSPNTPSKMAEIEFKKYSMTDDMKIPDNLPDWIKGKIMNSVEMKIWHAGLNSDADGQQPYDNDIPF